MLSGQEVDRRGVAPTDVESAGAVDQAGKDRIRRLSPLLLYTPIVLLSVRCPLSSKVSYSQLASSSPPLKTMRSAIGPYVPSSAGGRVDRRGIVVRAAQRLAVLNRVSARVDHNRYAPIGQLTAISGVPDFSEGVAVARKRCAL